MAGRISLPLHERLHHASGPCVHELCFCAQIVQLVGMGVVVFDMEQRTIILVNASAEETFARLGVLTDFEPLHRLLVPPDVDLARLSGPLVPEPLRLQSRLVSRTLHASPPLAWALVQDITDKVRLESIAEAVEMMNNIGFVFSALRHELGNPVNSLKAALSVLQANIDRYSREAILEYIDRMRYEVSRVEGLLRSMKSFSMYEHQERRRIDVTEFLASFRRLVQEGAESRGIELTVVNEEALCAHCDPRVLQQALLNVFANAVDAVAGVPRPSVTLTASRQGDLLSLRVEDNGPGVTAEQKSQLFKPFFTSKEHGTGLGLVISRKLLAGMDGTITVESEEGRGATVVITLPLCPVSP